MKHKAMYLSFILGLFMFFYTTGIFSPKAYAVVCTSPNQCYAGFSCPAGCSSTTQTCGLGLICCLCGTPTPSPTSTPTPTPSCPKNTDSGNRVFSGLICYSISGEAGSGIVGGTQSCTVACTTTNTCVTKQGAQCFAGKGVSGFSNTSCAPVNLSAPLASCPTTMGLHMYAQDYANNPIAGVTFTIKYEGSTTGYEQTTTATSDANGNAVVNLLYSGDNYSITASQSPYTFSGAQTGEMNTLGSCGTERADGVTNAPCTFTGTPPNCTSGTSSCGACTGEPSNTCYANNGSQTCQHNQPSPCIPVSFSQRCTIDNCSAGYTCNNQLCIATAPTPTTAPPCSPTPADIMIINDASGSMGQYNPALKNATEHFVDDISQNINNRVGLTVFNQTEGFGVTPQTTLLSGLTSNFSGVKSLIAGYDTGQTTCAQCGIKLSDNEISAHGRAGKKKVGVLITDGYPNNIEGTAPHPTVDPNLAANDALNEARNGHSLSGTQFYTVGMGFDPTGNFLGQMSQDTCGPNCYYYALDTSTLNSIYDSISRTALCTGPTATRHITGNVYVDSNLNGQQDFGEVGYSGATVTAVSSTGSTQTTTTDASGRFTFTTVDGMFYTVTLTVPNNYRAINPNPPVYPNVLTNGFDQAINGFGIAANYGISGNVYLDTNNDQHLDNGESTYGPSTVTFTGPTNSTINTANGVFTTNNSLLPGQYTVSYTPPSGYYMSYPQTGSPAQFNVTVGPGCDTKGANDASCSTGTGGPVTADTINASSAVDTSFSTPDVLQWNHTVGTQNNRVLLVGVNISDGGNIVTSITYNGTNLTRLALQDCGASCPNEVWYLVNPPSGTHQISIIFAGGNEAAAGAITFYNVDQTIPFGTVVPPYASNNGDTPSSTVTVPSSLNQLIFDSLTSIQPALGISVGFGQTQLWKTSTENNGVSAASVKTAGSGTTTMGWSWTFSGNKLWAEIAVPLNPVQTSAGSITGLNFGVTNNIPWYQSICGDVRQDNGINNSVPSTAACGGTSGPYAMLSAPVCSSNPGVVFSGNTNPSFGAGQASANPYNWSAGNTSYSEKFKPVNTGVIRTSYSYMATTAKQSGLSTADMNTSAVCGVGGIAACTLNTTLPHGLYQSNGPLTLTGLGYTFPANPPNQDYVILVNGDLTIKEPIHVPAGITATFSVSGNIYVDPSVGESSNTSIASDIEGFYSTDKSFIISGTPNVCQIGSTDKKLNIAGSVVVNAGFTGGTFQNQRDLCSGNITCPVVTFTQRPDFLLNAPDFIKHATSLLQEIAP